MELFQNVEPVSQKNDIQVMSSTRSGLLCQHTEVLANAVGACLISLALLGNPGKRAGGCIASVPFAKYVHCGAKVSPSSKIRVFFDFSS